MTRQETFKRRIRERMAHTGEKYGAARRVLIAQAGSGADRGDGPPSSAEAPPARVWVSSPDTAEEALVDATGHGYDHWCDVIDAWPGHVDGHAAVAAHLVEAHGVEGWWAQNITVGWERITGRRLRHQMADGTFTAGRSRTVAVDAAALRALLLDADGRQALFGGIDTELRSRPTAKVPRIAIGPGVAQVAIEALPDGRARIAVAHEKLPDATAVETWKAFWGEWLDALQGSG